MHILNTHHPSIKLRQEHSDFEINEPPDALMHFMVHMINNPHSGVAWAVQGRFSLEIKNVVYAIQCRSCGLIYVGETGARLRAVTAAPVCCTSSGGGAQQWLSTLPFKDLHDLNCTPHLDTWKVSSRKHSGEEKNNNRRKLFPVAVTVALY